MAILDSFGEHLDRDDIKAIIAATDKIITPGDTGVRDVPG
jgi:hypothetical protein